MTGERRGSREITVLMEGGQAGKRSLEKEGKTIFWASISGKHAFRDTMASHIEKNLGFVFLVLLEQIRQKQVWHFRPTTVHLFQGQYMICACRSTSGQLGGWTPWPVTEQTRNLKALHNEKPDLREPHYSLEFSASKVLSKRSMEKEGECKRLMGILSMREPWAPSSALHGSLGTVGV